MFNFRYISHFLCLPCIRKAAGRIQKAQKSQETENKMKQNLSFFFLFKEIRGRLSYREEYQYRHRGRHVHDAGNAECLTFFRSIICRCLVFSREKPIHLATAVRWGGRAGKPHTAMVQSLHEMVLGHCFSHTFTCKLGPREN